MDDGSRMTADPCIPTIPGRRVGVPKQAGRGGCGRALVTNVEAVGERNIHAPDR